MTAAVNSFIATNVSSSKKHRDVTPEELNMNNPCQMYMNQLAAYPLLTEDEEYHIGCRIFEGNMAQKHLESNPNRRNAESLRKAVQDGMLARKELVNGNLRLVISIAHKYNNGVFSFDDLIQEGNCGLLIAAERYNIHYGYRFSTYATPWVKRSIVLAIKSQSSPIRLPNYMHDKMLRILGTIRDAEVSGKPTPSISELAVQVGCKASSVQECLEIMKGFQSLDELIGDSSTHSIQEVLGDNNSNTAHIIEEKECRRDVASLIASTLTPRENEVIVLHFGFGMDKPLSLAEIGKRTNLSREAVRQIQLNAQKKLAMACKTNPNSARISCFLYQKEKQQHF